MKRWVCFVLFFACVVSSYVLVQQPVFGEVSLAGPSSEVSLLKQEADGLLKKGFLNQAVLRYEKVLQLEPNYANACYNLAIAYYLLRDYKRASLSLEKFLELIPDDAEAHYNLACLKLCLEDLVGAKRHFQAATRCPCPRGFDQKIKEGLQFVRDLENESPSARALILYLLSTGIQFQ